MVICAGTPRILVVEDEFLVALHIEDTLRRLGYEIIGPVGDLPNAMRLAEAETLSAAILDVHLQHGERVFPVSRSCGAAAFRSS
jgi:DNA-binding response OmpR family regulator